MKKYKQINLETFNFQRASTNITVILPENFLIYYEVIFHWHSAVSQHFTAVTVYRYHVGDSIEGKFFVLVQVDLLSMVISLIDWGVKLTNAALKKRGNIVPQLSNVYSQRFINVNEVRRRLRCTFHIATDFYHKMSFLGSSLASPVTHTLQF